MDSAAPKRIGHVFVLMLENRSFDHLLGFSDIRGIDLETTEPTSVDGLGSAEFANDFGGTHYVASTGAPFALEVDPGHSFVDVLEQLAGEQAQYRPAAFPQCDLSGFASNFAKYAKPADIGRILQAFAAPQLPALNALAREFCICDHWFSSLPGPTMPNRLFVHAASSAGLDDSPDLASLGGEILSKGFAFKNGTIFDRLKAAKMPWTVWEGDEFPTALVLRGMLPADLEEELGLTSTFRDFSEFAAAVQDPNFGPVYSFIEPSYGELFFGQHMKCGTSMHPVDDVTRGDGLIKAVYEAIRKSPHWPESLLIVTFDEHGGFFDHVAPGPATPPGDGPYDPLINRNKFDFSHLGVRVPTIVVSPWVPRNSIDHRQYDHSSVPRTIEDIFSLPALTKRDASASSLSKVLILDAMRDDAPEELPAPAVSNIGGCDGGMASWLEKVSGELTLAFERQLAPNPVTQTFLHIAIRREVEMSGLLAAKAMVDDIRNIRSQQEAAAYIHHTRLKYRGFKGQRG